MFRVLFQGPHHKDYNILGSILGSPHFEKLPYTDPDLYRYHSWWLPLISGCGPNQKQARILLQLEKPHETSKQASKQEEPLEFICSSNYGHLQVTAC